MKLFILLLLAVFIESSAFTQTTTFSKVFGGFFQDAGVKVVENNDGTFTILGTTRNLGNTSGIKNIYLLKVNATGDSIWGKTYGDTLWTDAISFIKTPDEGYIVVGDQKQHLYILHANSSGDEIWSKRLVKGSISWLSSIATIDNSNYALIGTESISLKQNVLFVRINNLGDTLFTSSFSSGLDLSLGSKTFKTFDNGFYIAGVAANNLGNEPNNLLLLKMDLLGTPLWSKIYSDFSISDAIKYDENTYYIVGNDENFDMKLIRTNALGDTIWSKKYLGYSAKSIKKNQQ